MEKIGLLAFILNLAMIMGVIFLMQPNSFTNWSNKPHQLDNSKPMVVIDNPSAEDRPETGPKVIDYTSARNHIGEVKTVQGKLQIIFNNGAAVYFGYKIPHQGEFKVKILSEYWKNFPIPPENIYKVGQTIRVTGKLVWYQGDPIIYATEPAQLQLIKLEPKNTN